MLVIDLYIPVESRICKYKLVEFFNEIIVPPGIYDWI